MPFQWPWNSGSMRIFQRCYISMPCFCCPLVTVSLKTFERLLRLLFALAALKAMKVKMFAILFFVCVTFLSLGVSIRLFALLLRSKQEIKLFNKNCNGDATYSKKRKKIISCISQSSHDYSCNQEQPVPPATHYRLWPGCLRILFPDLFSFLPPQMRMHAICMDVTCSDHHLSSFWDLCLSCNTNFCHTSISKTKLWGCL